jgi:RimJ/RimL family protein N-acetyltransferase
LQSNYETKRGLIFIREALVTDIDQFRALRLYALQESPASFPGEYSTYVNRPQDFWEDRLKAEGNKTLYFAEHEGQLIGMTGIRRGEWPKTKHSAEIWGVYVRPEWRGLHIAEMLIEACTDWAKAKGVNILNLGVTAASTSAVRCYQRCGFTICGTEPRGIFYDGKYYDGYFMFKLLDDL